MAGSRGVVSGTALASLLVWGVVPVAAAADLSRYRTFQFGAQLSAVTGQAGADSSQVKVIHRRPALVQELQWRPRTSGSSFQTEPVKEAVFSFYNGKLFRIAISYDHYRTEGMTADDMVEAISATYGTATKPLAAAVQAGSFGDTEEVLAQWQDLNYGFDLVRLSYGPSFKLVGVMKSLDGPAQAAIVESRRLDDLEAPQRDAARTVTEEEAARATLEKARLTNKPKFRP